MINFKLHTVHYPGSTIRYLNTSAPFDLDEHDGVWKDPRYAPWGFDEYKDFTVALIHQASGSPLIVSIL